MTTSVTDSIVATLKASGSAVHAAKAIVSSGEDAPIELAEANSRQMEME
jgi:hypothetical protein